MFLFVIVGILILLIYKTTINTYNYWKSRDIPCIKPWPIFGNMGPFVFGQKSLAETVVNIYNKYPNARYVGINQFLKPTLMITDVDLIKQIGITDFDHFVDRRTFVSEKTDPLFEKTLFALTGQQWKNMRSTLSPSFSSSKIRSMFVLISEIADRFINHLTKNINSEKTVSFEMKDLFTRFTNDVIATSAFGIKCDSLEEHENEFYAMGKRINLDGFIDSLKLFGYTFSPALMKFMSVKLFNKDVSSFVRDIVLTTMRVRKEKGIIRPDMIHLLMETRKENADQKFLTDEDIVAQALFFFFAGFETTSTLLCHMANELAQNVDIQKKLQNEIDDTIKKFGARVDYETLLELKYLDMVVSETLRKWPPVPVSDRKCVKPYIIQPENDTEKPVHIYKGDYIWFPIFAIHRDPKHFPNPEKFDPERFNNDNKHNIKKNSNLPFGIGPRTCLGIRFALLEAKIVYFHLLAKFDLTVVKETQIPFKHKRFQFNIHSQGGFWVGITPRK